MKQMSQILRFVLPAVYGLILIGMIPLPPVLSAHWNPVAAVVMGAMLMLWPRLWTLSLFPIIDMYAYGMGAGFRADMTAMIDSAAPLMSAIPLLLIGISSAVRRLPGPRPEIKGTIVPNADGVGALLALPVAYGLASTGRSGLLLTLAVVFAVIRIIGYGRKNELWQRGRGWIAFLIGVVAALAYYARYSVGDPELLKYYGPLAAVPIGIMAWAVQRAIIPYRNPTTQP